MSFVAAAIGAAGVIGGAYIASRASKNAAATQQSASNDANRLQWDMYQQGREDSAPWRHAGQQGLSALLYGMGIGNPAGYGQPGYDGQPLQTGGSAPPVAGGERPSDMVGFGPRNPTNYLRSFGEYQAAQQVPTNDNVLLRPSMSPMRSAALSDGSGMVIGGPVSKSLPTGYGEPTMKSYSQTGWMPSQQDSRQEFGNLLRDFRMSDYMSDPGYQFRLQQGEDAINRNALAKGRYNSGSVLRALQDFNSGLASQEFQSSYNRFRGQQGDRYNRIAALSGVGQTQTNLDNQNRMATAGQIGGNLIGAGNAAAAGQIGHANAWAGALNNGINWYQGNQMVNAIKGNNSQPLRDGNGNIVY